jgi:exodeoxyribonuclease VII small subunit
MRFSRRAKPAQAHLAARIRKQILMKKKSEQTENFDGRLARLQEIVSALEAGDLPLEKALALYKEGTALSRLCREQLERARNEMLLCAESGPRAFDPEDAPEDDAERRP